MGYIEQLKSFDLESMFEEYEKQVKGRNVPGKELKKEKLVYLFNLKVVLYKLLSGFSSSLNIYVDNLETKNKYKEALDELEDCASAVNKFLLSQFFAKTKVTPFITNSLLIRLKVFIRNINELCLVLEHNQPQRKLRKFLSATLNVIHEVFYRCWKDSDQHYAGILPNKINVVDDVKEITPFLKLIEQGAPKNVINRRLWKVVDSFDESNLEDLFEVLKTADE